MIDEDIEAAKSLAKEWEEKITRELEEVQRLANDIHSAEGEASKGGQRG